MSRRSHFFYKTINSTNSFTRRLFLFKKIPQGDDFYAANSQTCLTSTAHCSSLSCSSRRTAYSSYKNVLSPAKQVGTNISIFCSWDLLFWNNVKSALKTSSRKTSCNANTTPAFLHFILCIYNCCTVLHTTIHINQSKLVWRRTTNILYTTCLQCCGYARNHRMQTCRSFNYATSTYILSNASPASNFFFQGSHVHTTHSLLLRIFPSRHGHWCWFLDDGLYWFLRQAGAHSYQQHHCWAIICVMFSLGQKNGINALRACW